MKLGKHNFKCENEYVSDKIFKEIDLIQIIIYSFIKFKCYLVSLKIPLSTYCKMHCSWPTEDMIDYSSFRLNMLIIQQVFTDVQYDCFHCVSENMASK